MQNLKLIGILLIFLLVGFIFIFFPIYSSFNLLSAIASGSDRIAFDKGAYYLFGGGLSSAQSGFCCYWPSVRRRQTRQKKWGTRKQKECNG